MTHTEVSDVQLKDLDFPLSIQICVKPAQNETALQVLGYEDSSGYLLGRSKYNNSLIGWGGHNDNGKGNANAEEVIIAAKINVTQGLLSRVSFTTVSGKRSGNLLDRVHLDIINQISECYILNLSNIDEEEKRGIKFLNIWMSREVMVKNNLTVELKLQGQNLVAARDIVEHAFFSPGGPIKIDYRALKLVKYIARLKKSVFVEEDPSKRCRNYPNSDFASYRECDLKYLRDNVNQFGLDLTPPWLSDDLKKVSVKPLYLSNEILGKKM